MSEVTSAAAPAAAVASPQVTPAAPAPAATPAPAAPSDRIVLAVQAMEAARAARAAPATPAPAAGAPPVTPEVTPAPKEPESASSVIRLKAQLASERKAFEQSQTAWKAEQAQKQAQMASWETAAQQFEEDPVAFAKAHGKGRSLAEIAKDLYLGQIDPSTLPPERQEEYKRVLTEHNKEKELKTLKRDQERLRQEMQAEKDKAKTEIEQAKLVQQIQGYRQQLFSEFPGLTDETPLVKQLAVAAPDWALDLLMDVAGRVAVQANAEGITIRVPTAAELAKDVEESLAKQLSPFESHYEKKYKPAPALAPVQVAPVATPARSSSLTGLSDVTPVRKKPTTRQELIEAGVEAWKSVRK